MEDYRNLDFLCMGRFLTISLVGGFGVEDQQNDLREAPV
jgi:hypothetical protein